jgi:pimeloyl-ACP methyl ester carboxylesterase
VAERGEEEEPVPAKRERLVVRESSVRASDGSSLHVQSAGTGPTVLLIHGLGYAAWAGAPLRSHLVGAGYRFLTFDNRGTGGSEKPTGPYTIQQMADDATSVVDAEGQGPVHVIGYSMGGYIALQMAVSRPSVVRSLTLIATSAGGPGAMDVPETTRRAWEAASGGTPEQFARATMPLSFRPGWTQSHPESFEALLRTRLAAPTPSQVWRAQYEASARHLHSGLDVTGIHVPALVLHGTKDRVVPHSNGTLLASQLPNARFRSLEDAGHLSWIEDPPTVAREIVRFLAEVSASTAAAFSSSVQI